MPAQPPPIDQRGDGELVAQTEQLALCFTGWGRPERARPDPAALVGRLLVEEVLDPEGEVIARAGALIDQELAARIAAARPDRREVLLRQPGRGRPEAVPADPALLAGRVLAETVYDARGAVVAPAASLISAEGAAAIAAARPAPAVVDVLAPPADMGRALIELFGAMAGQVVERVNRLPDKHFLAFLDLIGTTQLPPQPARVPLTFIPAAGGAVDPVVPALTQVGAPAEAGGAEALFETERDLIVTRAALAAAHVRNPGAGSYADVGAVATGAVEGSFSPFQGTLPSEHMLYLANDALLAMPGPKTITVTLVTAAPALLAALPLAWSYYDGAVWRPLLATAAPAADGKSLVVTFADPPIPEPTEVEGRSARWLRAQLNMLHVGATAGAGQPLTIPMPGARDLARSPVSWARWDGAAWRPVELRVDPQDDALVARDPRGAAFAAGDILRAQFLRPLTAAPQGPPLLAAAGVPAGGASEPVNLAAPFYPLGRTPSAGASFELCLDPQSVAAGQPLTFAPAILDRGVGTGDLLLTWSYFVGGREQWKFLGQSSRDQAALPGAAPGFADETLAFTRPGAVSLIRPADWLARSRELGAGPARTSVNGLWLRAVLTRGGYTEQRSAQPPRVVAWSLPAVEQIVVGATATVPPSLAPDSVALNQVPVDTSKDFRPFGERPAFNDSFYLASAAALARPNADVIVDITLSPSVTSQSGPTDIFATGGLTLAWEVWDGARWLELGRTTASEPAAPAAGAARPRPTITSRSTREPAPFNDESAAFTVGRPADTAGEQGNTRPGRVTLRLPPALAPTSVGGVEGFWLRVRILRGGYGAPPSLADGRFVDSAPFRPPVLAAIRIGYSATQQAPPSHCLSVNDFVAADRTAAAAANDGRPFAPFAPGPDTRPALYLGFDRPFANRPALLYMQVEPAAREVDPRQRGSDDWGRTVLAGGPPQVVWEYAAPDGWALLGVQDETRAFAERGLIGFVGPADLVRRREFGRELYWLRARWHRGAYPILPRLRRVLLNTVWALQSVSARGERLGVSDGSPGQRFRAVRAPILPGQQLEVREATTLNADERAAVEAAEGPDAITPHDAGPERAGQVWVRWHAVADFYGSGRRDRHYTLDRLSGEVRFGDGRRGLIPPAGAVIRLAGYSSGGGVQGDRPAGAVVELKTAIPYVDGVINYEPALGGADREPLDSVRVRGPRAIRNRGRAVTVEDYEDLAFEASPDVARALALPPPGNPLDIGNPDFEPVEGKPRRPRPLRHNDQSRRSKDPQSRVLMLEGAFNLRPELARTLGRVRLAIVPRNDAARPEPSLELLDRVEDYLRARCTAALSPVGLWVTGPDWYEVSVTAEIAPVSLAAAGGLERLVLERLRRFLHPLTGGPDGAGWGFGRRPHDSDLYALIEAIPGVDHLRSLRVDVTPEPPRDDSPNPLLLVYSGRHSIRLLAAGEGV